MALFDRFTHRKLSPAEEAHWRALQQSNAPGLEAMVEDVDDLDPDFAAGQEQRRRVEQDQVLIAALDQGNTADLKALLEQGGNPNARILRDVDYITGDETVQDYALHHAKTAEHTQMLLDAGARVNVKNEYGQSPLHVAQDPQQVSVLIDHGADLAAKDFGQSAPLHAAQSPEVAQAMLEHGADVHAQNYAGDTPLHRAKRTEMAQVLLDHGADVNARNTFGSTPLHQVETPDMAHLLIDHGADVHALNKLNNTPLHDVLMGSPSVQKLEVGQVLIEEGADLNHTNIQGKTPMDVSRQYNYKDFHEGLQDVFQAAAEKRQLREAVDQGFAEARQEAPQGEPRSGALDAAAQKQEPQAPLQASSGQGLRQDSPEEVLFDHLAAGRNQEAMAFLKDNPDFDVKAPLLTSTGTTALHVARSPEMMQALIDRGADVNAQDIYGATPLHDSVARGLAGGSQNERNFDAAETLLRNGADPSLQDRDGKTAMQLTDKHRQNVLHVAETPSQADAFARAGADVNAVNKHSLTPLHCAQSAGIAETLLDHGAEVDARDRLGNTPLHYAAQKEDPAQAITLMAHGADRYAQNIVNQTPGEAATDQALAGMNAYDRRQELSQDIHQVRAAQAPTQEPEQPRTPEAMHQDLMQALDHPQPETQNERIQGLIQEGAPVNQVASLEGREDRALHHAQTAEHSKMLLDAGADVHAQDQEGRTALHVAKDPAQVSLLANHDADITALDKEGNTPLHTAQNPQVAQALMDEGAYPRLKNERGQRADEMPNVKEARAADLAKTMDEARGKGMGTVTDEQRQKMYEVAPPESRATVERIRTMGDRAPQPEVPNAPARRRL